MRTALPKTGSIFRSCGTLRTRISRSLASCSGIAEEYCARLPILPEPLPPRPSSQVRQAKPREEAERRQVTVMFADLVGSTALSACMDPEDLREVISAYQQCVAETVRHFGGFVARYLGDGVLGVFWLSASP